MSQWADQYDLTTKEGRSMWVDKMVEELNRPIQSWPHPIVPFENSPVVLGATRVGASFNYNEGSGWYWVRNSPFKERCECYVTRK